MQRRELIELLQLTGGEQEWLFQQARKLRAETYGEVSLLRGVIELTNECRVNCDYCPMRRDNLKQNQIFHLDRQTILATVEKIRQQGINVVFFQAGESPRTARLIGELLPEIRSLFADQVEILLNLGVLRRDEYRYLREQGATSYIIKHETSDAKLHRQLRHEPLQKRLHAIEELLELGYYVGTGCIVGLPGQRIESVADDLLLAQSLGVHMCSVSTFIPAPHTPLATKPAGNVQLTLNAIAAMRIMSPRWFIPSVSALEKLVSGGQLLGFHAGANVMTINFTPSSASDKYLIYGEDRFVVKMDHARQTIQDAGLQTIRSVW